MNGATNISTATQTIKEEPGSWGKEDQLMLLDRIKSLLPEDDCMKFKTTESHFDWEKVRFGPYTGDMCKQKWLKLSMEVRKFRTMTELIADAMEFVRNPYKGKKLKMKYIEEFQQEKEAFEGSMARFREEHPELLEEPKKSDLPEKPKTPQQLWYNHEKKGFLKLHPDVSPKDLKDALRKQWSQLADKKRLKWISKALELQKDYEVNMKAYLEAHPQSVQEDLVKSVLTKAERQLKDKFDGRPTKPPTNGYSLYCAELMVNMKEVPSTERMVLCSRRWKMMSQKEKDMYQKLCEQKKKQYEVDIQRFLVSLPDEERERVLMEEKLGGARSTSPGQAASPPLAKSPTSKRELVEMRSTASAQALKKQKFDGEPKKPPTSGYQMFSQELLTNGELNHFSLKERMVEIGRRWQRLSQPLKDGYKKMVEEHQTEYKAELESWIQSLSAPERAAYMEYANAKRRASTKPGAPLAKVPNKRTETSDDDDDDDDEEQSDSDSGDEDDSSASSDSDDDDDDDDDENDDDEEQSEVSSSSSSSSSQGSSDSDSD